MKFLADMGISPQTVAFLRDHGYDADHLIERGEQQLEDRHVLELARDETRILLAHDLDFSDLVAGGGLALPSVVVFRLRSMRPTHVNQRLKRLMDRHEQVLQEGAVFSVTETRIRWRRLPFDADDL
jgi:predicted nuclease of predicted toxin-antitoxin system